MNFDPISVEMSQHDAAVAAVILAEYAGRQSLKALIKDMRSTFCGSSNKEERELAQACSRASIMLADALMSVDAGLQSAYALKQSNDAMAAATAAAACEARGDQA